VLQVMSAGYVEAFKEHLENKENVYDDHQHGIWTRLGVTLYLIFVKFLLYQKQVEERGCRKITFALSNALP
jgi:hypothetical protein